MQYRTRGTCSTMINLTLDENHVIQDLHFTGGCKRAEDVIPKIEGIRCGFKNTSCPDQLSKALKQAIGQ